MEFANSIHVAQGHEVTDIVAPGRNEDSFGAAHSDFALRGKKGRSLPNTEATHADIQHLAPDILTSTLAGTSLKDPFDDRYFGATYRGS